MPLPQKDKKELEAKGKDTKYLKILAELVKGVSDPESAKLISDSVDKLTEVMKDVDKGEDKTDLMVDVLKEIQKSNEKLGENNNDKLIKNLELLTKDLITSNNQNKDSFKIVAEELKLVKLSLDNNRNAEWEFQLVRDQNSDISTIKAKRIK